MRTSSLGMSFYVHYEMHSFLHFCAASLWFCVTRVVRGERSARMNSTHNKMTGTFQCYTFLSCCLCTLLQWPPSPYLLRLTVLWLHPELVSRATEGTNRSGRTRPALVQIWAASRMERYHKGLWDRVTRGM